MKVNEEKAKELIEWAGQWKKTALFFLNFETKNDIGKKIDLDDFMHHIGKMLNEAADLIYKTFPE